jgi:hypothetical protein
MMHLPAEPVAYSRAEWMTRCLLLPRFPPLRESIGLRAEKPAEASLMRIAAC